MTSHKSRYKNALEIVVVAILLLAGYAIFQRLTGTSAVLLESNLQSNLARASRYLNASKVDTVLVGSSMTGRLLPSYFKGEGMNISNLGLDGCHAPFGLEIILMRKDLPQRVLIETASLDHDPNANEKTVREASRSGGWLKPSVLKIDRYPSYTGGASNSVTESLGVVVTQLSSTINKMLIRLRSPQKVN
jgi:hypothetical protein